MGDRANVIVKQGRDKVVLYTHWHGSELPRILRNALERGLARWTDPAYLARIIFSEMVRDDIDGETGYGISATVCDNEYPFLICDDKKQAVVVTAAVDSLRGYQPGEALITIPYAEYVKIKNVSWEFFEKKRLAA